jgi:uncharacterized protein YndB with AHSA1/START domain
MKVQKSVEIAAPPKKIWSFMTEPEKVLQWYIPLQKFEYTTDKRNTVGAPLYYEEKTALGLIKFNCVVTEWVEKEKFAFKMNSGNMMKTYEEMWAVEPTPAGSKFTCLVQGELPLGIIGKLLNPFAERGTGSTVEKMLAKLKNLAEA